MIKRPRFAPWLRTCDDSADGVLLISERYQRLLTGRVACLLAPLIDGRRRSDELVDLLEEEAPAAEVYYALSLLEKQGYLVEADGPPVAGPDAFWGAVNQIPQQVAEPGLGAGATLFSFGAVPDSTAAEALVALGLPLRDGADFAVALTDDYLRAGLDDFNYAALKSGRPWLICKPVGSILWIGPIFRRGKTGCWECLAGRLRDKRPHERYLAQKAGSPSQVHIPQLSLASTLQTGLGLAATETGRWLACGQSPLEGVLVTFDLARLTSEHHVLVRRPQCPRCGDAEYQADRKPEPTRVRARDENGAPNGEGKHSTTPEATLARFGHHVSPLTGIVSNLRRLSKEVDILRVYTAESNILRRSDIGSLSRPRLRNRSFGKGTTDAEARCCALCEALERHSAYAQGYEPRVCASLRELGEPAIHPNDCMLFSDQQYRDRNAWNAVASMAQFVPEPFDPDALIDWAPVWSLTRGDWRYLPSQYCYFDYPAGERRRFCRADSNGNAAGNDIEEAILRGFFELVERDCVAIWWYNRILRPGVDLSSFSDPYIEELLRSYRAMERDVWALDLTNDLGIPAFAAASRQTSAPEEGLVMGFGANFDARAGMVHALTEMNQFLGLMRDRAGGGGEDGADRNPELETWWKAATLTDHPFLAPDRTAGPRTAGSYPVGVRQEPLDAIDRCRAVAGRLGLELLALDLTRPDIGLSVVKVIVPGLRHFWRRVGPGRLYDVPVRLGWLKKPLAEAQLNPTPVFL